MGLGRGRIEARDGRHLKLPKWAANVLHRRSRAIVPAPEAGVTTHRVIGVLTANRDRLSAFQTDFSALFPDPTQDRSAQDQRIREQLAWLPDALVAAGDFALHPQDMMGIFTETERLFPRGANRFSEIVTTAYAVQGLTGRAKRRWKDFPAEYFQTGEIPERLRSDRTSLQHVRERVEQVLDYASLLSSRPEYKQMYSLEHRVVGHFNGTAGGLRHQLNSI